MDFRTAQKLVKDNKIAKGFNQDVPTEVCLLQGELAEFFHAWRRGQQDMGEELADVVLYALGRASWESTYKPRSKVRLRRTRGAGMFRVRTAH